ncbi:hypothetical protein ACFL0P_02620 [Candidatus Omnitrophota bacterium]
MINNRGISLVATVIIMLIIATLALVVASTMSSGNISSVADMQAQQAFYLAHAGLEWYMEQLENDSDWSSPPTVKTDQSFDVGTFSVTYANEATNSIDITATGKVTGWDWNDVQRVITQHVERSAGGYSGGTPEAFDYGFHGFGSWIDFKNSTGTVNGDVASSSSVKNYGSMTINGTVTESSSVDDPTPVDTDGYEAIADNVESGGFTFTEGNTYGSAGSEEIWYIDGSATIERNVTIYGSVIARLGISMAVDSLTIDAASGYPALIAGGNISGDGLSDSTINGLISADGNIDFDNLDTVTMNTSILAGGNISIKTGASFTINYDSDIATNPPPYFEGYATGAITTSLWQESL